MEYCLEKQVLTRDESDCESKSSEASTISAKDVAGSKIYLFIKRCFDILASGIGAIILCVPMLLIAVVVYIDSPGSVIFCQERLGKDGRPFMLYKFRSMQHDAENNGPQWAREDDERCTKVGHFLRKTHLDELPQLYNILRGDMSFVGPRPERAYFYDQFETYIPGFRDRLLVIPGLTGYAQISGGYNLRPEEKIVYDIKYIKNRSIKLDLYCLLKTIPLIFSHKGAR